MEIFGITGSISQRQIGSDVMEGDSARAEMSTACDIKVGSSSQDENSTAPPTAKRMRLDTDRMDQPAAEVPFHSNNCRTPLIEAEQERLLAESSSLTHYALQESDITKKVGDEMEKREIVELPENSKVHSQEFASHPLDLISAEETESDVIGQIRGTPGVLQGDEDVVKSHLGPITCDDVDASAFEKCALSTYAGLRDSSVTAEISVSTIDEFQQEFYDNAYREHRTEEYQILLASHSVSSSSPSNVGVNPYGTLSGHREAEKNQDRPESLFRENAHACDRETKAEVNEERVMCDEEMADYASTGSIFTYDVTLSGDLGSNDPKINASLAHSVPSNAALWLSTDIAAEAEGLRKCDEYTAIPAQSGLSQMPANVYNDMAGVTEIDTGHEVSGPDRDCHIIPEHEQPEVNSQTSDSTFVTSLHSMSDVTLNGVIAFEEDTAQCPPFPEAYAEAPVVRDEVCELSDDHCTFVSPLNSDVENLNIALNPRSLSEDDEQLVINYVSLNASLLGTNGRPGEGATTEETMRVHHQGSQAFVSFTKPAESLDISVEAVADSYSHHSVEAQTDLLALASLVSDSMDHHESRLEAAVCSSPGGILAMEEKLLFFKSSPSPSEIRLKLQSEDWKEESEELSDGVASQQLVTLPWEENAKVTDAVAHSDTSHEFTVKDMPVFTLCSDAVVPGSHSTPTEDVTKESPVLPGYVFFDCVHLGFDSFEKVKISPDSDLENSPLLDRSPTALVAAAVTHVHSVPPPDNSPVMLTHSRNHSDKTIELISHYEDNGPVSAASFSKDRGTTWGGEESQKCITVASLPVASPQQSISPFEPEENISPSDRITDNDVPMLEMKEMFDSVIEELCMYFEIGQEEEESNEVPTESRKEDSKVVTHFSKERTLHLIIAL
ncbi:uncharacterized protein LOC116223697 [Clupea harengus]|uniref:Uncharacterized protein LOC116223697 n=1 Tax=Clupea harengus TaxID=7950 RepID=A0A8M1KP37_CLUHA|nr:uncharacterized protein LOC116223697 [Clupea harengus]